MEMSEQQIKTMVIMNIIDNCTMELDNTGQERYSLDEQQFGKCVDTLVKNINVIQCCVNKDLDKHPIEGVNDFMLTDQEIEDTQFYCAGVEAGNRICESQCIGCCGFQRSYEQ